ncbi:hypothetical protein D5086_007537 [Populus alba]|uniref:Uncharacterized protein n=1 Tax=Populus alba TaxID=43335 RepID=A0ACC4CPZ4_POPAL
MYSTIQEDTYLFINAIPRWRLCIQFLVSLNFRTTNVRQENLLVETENKRSKTWLQFQMNRILETMIYKCYVGIFLLMIKVAASIENVFVFDGNFELGGAVSSLKRVSSGSLTPHHLAWVEYDAPETQLNVTLAPIHTGQALLPENLNAHVKAQEGRGESENHAILCYSTPSLTITNSLMYTGR